MAAALDDLRALAAPTISRAAGHALSVIHSVRLFRELDRACWPWRGHCSAHRQHEVAFHILGPEEMTSPFSKADDAVPNLEVGAAQGLLVEAGSAAGGSTCKVQRLLHRAAHRAHGNAWSIITFCVPTTRRLQVPPPLWPSSFRGIRQRGRRTFYSDASAKRVANH